MSVSVSSAEILRTVMILRAEQLADIGVNHGTDSERPKKTPRLDGSGDGSRVMFSCIHLLQENHIPALSPVFLQ
jgi:hypothetical protein